MISMNLLPDSKMDRLKAQRRQRVIGASSTLAIAVGIGLPVLLIILWLGQKGLIRLTQNSIDEKIRQLQQVEKLDEILTVQRQLNSLTSVEEQRLYYTTVTNLLPKLMPRSASLASIEMGEGNTIILHGTANSVASINDFVNILDNTDLVKDGVTSELFTNVVLRQVQPTDKGASFEINASFDAQLLARKLGGEIRVGDRVVVPFVAEPPADQATGSKTQEPATEGVFGDQPAPTEANP
jgi:Tfp pilus assembly protein PilN